MEPETDDDRGRDTLSTVSTVLGLTLFFLFVIVVVVRRVYIYRVNRLAGIGLFGSRTSIDSSDDDYEPRAIAIGARAALLKRPELWEDCLLHQKPSATWSHLQPTNLQLTTPHTTAKFPANSNSPGTSPHSNPRSYLIFHTQATSPQRHSVLSPPPILPPEEKPQPSCPQRHPHPVQVTFLISMPNPSRFQSHTSLSHPPIPPIEFGTTTPIVNLSSLQLPRAELDSWWDLPNRRNGHNGRERERIRDILGFSFQNYP